MLFKSKIKLSLKDKEGIRYVFKILNKVFGYDLKELRKTVGQNKKGEYSFNAGVHDDIILYNRNDVITIIKTTFEYEMGEYNPILTTDHYKVILDIHDDAYIFRVTEEELNNQLA